MFLLRLNCMLSLQPQVLDSKGIREAVQEKNPVKALNSFAIRDIIDDIDSPLIEITATVSVGVEVSLELIGIGVKGRLTIVVGASMETLIFIRCL